MFTALSDRGVPTRMVCFKGEHHELSRSGKPLHRLRRLGIEWTDYDVTVVKQGYIFPDFKAQAQFYVMSLTDGATPQDTASIPFKRIMRPMYPIDQI